MRHYTSAMLDNIQQNLIELMADFLDSESVKLDEAIGLISEPVKKEESELHIRMAYAAFMEYKNTMLPESTPTPERTAEDVLKSKLTIEKITLNNPDYTFNKIIEAMEEYRLQGK